MTAFPGNIPKLGRFDSKQAVFTCTKAIKPIGASIIAAVNGGALVSIPAVDFDRFVHIDPPKYARALLNI